MALGSGRYPRVHATAPGRWQPHPTQGIRRNPPVFVRFRGPRASVPRSDRRVRRCGALGGAGRLASAQERSDEQGT